jgi:histidinol-phosphate aminotransferase
MSILESIRPELRQLRPYKAAEQVDDTIRLNANEAPWTNTNDQFRRPLNRYPEVRPAKLRRMLAEFYECAEENIVVTRGTSEGIDLLIRVFCRADRDALLTVTPTFSMYRHYAQIQGARLIEYATAPEQDFAVDVDALLDCCDDSVRLIFLCAPNNPTGNSIPVADLKRILESSRNAAVVVDEAYVEFSSQASVVSLVDKFENLIVLRTLSKALACAGARCGSVIANSDVVDILAAVQAPYALATPVVECVENALRDDGFEISRRWAQEIVSQRETMMANFADLEFVEQVWPSDANFFLCRIRSASAVLTHCADQGVLLRDFGRELKDCVRVTVGQRNENEHLLKVLREMPGDLL